MQPPLVKILITLTASSFAANSIQASGGTNTGHAVLCTLTPINNDGTYRPAGGSAQTMNATLSPMQWSVSFAPAGGNYSGMYLVTAFSMVDQSWAFAAGSPP